MGFEIKLYIIAETEALRGDNVRLMVGSFDLCKPGYTSAIGKLYDNGACDSLPRGTYIQGDKHRLNTEDKYGQETWAHPIEDVIKALQEDAKHDDYWRFQVALDFLVSVRDNWDWFGKPYVITYGH